MQTPQNVLKITDVNESRSRRVSNFFLEVDPIKFLQVKYRECHLSYAYSMLHTANNAKHVIA